MEVQVLKKTRKDLAELLEKNADSSSKGQKHAEINKGDIDFGFYC